MKNSVIVALFSCMTIALGAQTPKITEAKDTGVDESYKIDFTTWIREDIELSDRQKKEIDTLNTWTLAEVASMENEYEVNSDVHQNKFNLIMEERDARLANILTIEQFAIYLNNQAKALDYNSTYEAANIVILKRKDGRIKVDSEKGKIRISDRKLLVKNPATGEKTIVKRNAIEYANKETGEEVEVEEGKVGIETATKQEEVTKSSATKKTEEKSLNIQK